MQAPYKSSHSRSNEARGPARRCPRLVHHGAKTGDKTHLSGGLTAEMLVQCEVPRPAPGGTRTAGQALGRRQARRGPRRCFHEQAPWRMLYESLCLNDLAGRANERPYPPATPAAAASPNRSGAAASTAPARTRRGPRRGLGMRLFTPTLLPWRGDKGRPDDAWTYQPGSMSPTGRFARSYCSYYRLSTPSTPAHSSCSPQPINATLLANLDIAWEPGKAGHAQGQAKPGPLPNPWLGMGGGAEGAPAGQGATSTRRPTHRLARTPTALPRLPPAPHSSIEAPGLRRGLRLGLRLPWPRGSSSMPLPPRAASLIHRGAGAAAGAAARAAAALAARLLVHAAAPARRLTHP